MVQHVLERPGNDAHIEVAVGDEVVLRLDQASSGGYVWSLSEVPDFVAETTDEVAPLAAALPGRLRTRVVGLRATRPGEGQVLLTLRRPWEDTPAEQVRVRIVAS